MAFNQVLNEISDLPIKPFNMSRMKKEALIHTLQLQFEQGKLSIPYKDEGGTRRLMNTLLTELSTFTMLDNGRMESLGGHDDMVILALAVQATKEYRDNIVILDASVWQNRLGGQMFDNLDITITAEYGIESVDDVVKKLLDEKLYQQEIKQNSNGTKE